MRGERKAIEMVSNGNTKVQNGNTKGHMVCVKVDEGNDDKTSLTNLIVNYLPQAMSQDEIRSLFGSVGDIDSCKLIRDKATGQSLGYGFVNYKNAEHARKAIEALNGLRLQNKTIKVSLARPSCELIKGANLYVSGLSKSMTQRELEALFMPYGNIITSRILCDSQTGLSKGVGFVRFDLRTEAEHAIKKLNGAASPGNNGNETMTVKFANHPSANGSLMPTLPSNLGPFQAAVASYLSPSSRQLLTPLHSATGRIRYDSAPSVITNGLIPSSVAMNGWCLFVYNLAPDTEEKVLWQMFGPFGAVQNVKVVRDFSTQKCRGFGFVVMTNYDEALVAINCLNGYLLSNRVLQVSFKKAKGSVGGMSSLN